MNETFADVTSPMAEIGNNPFRRQGLVGRVLPFAIIAILAEASAGLPPGPQSWSWLCVSAILLVLIGLAFWLPWARMPSGLTVLVPLAYVGSVLALSLCTGANSGVGIVILVPVLWAALFHRRWETVCVIFAVIAAEWAVSAIQDMSGVVTVRRVVFWGLLSGVVAVAGHALRSRIRRSAVANARLEEQLRAASLARDRDRIAADLHEQVAARLLGASLSLHGAAGLTSDPPVERRIAGAIEDLDQAARQLREAIFGLAGNSPAVPGLRQRVLTACASLTPAPAVSLRGQVDERLPARDADQLVGLLQDALSQVITAGSVSALAIDATAAGDDIPGPVTMILTLACPEAGGWMEAVVAALSGRAAAAGAGFKADGPPGTLQLAWTFPAAPGRAGARRPCDAVTGRPARRRPGRRRAERPGC